MHMCNAHSASVAFPMLALFLRGSMTVVNYTPERFDAGFGNISQDLDIAYRPLSCIINNTY